VAKQIGKQSENFGTSRSPDPCFVTVWIACTGIFDVNRSLVLLLLELPDGLVANWYLA
jgi:hypothetical protein